MKNKAEILAENPNLLSYQITLLETHMAEDLPIEFDCYAEDDAHAVEQVENAYPQCAVLSITPFTGNES